MYRTITALRSFVFEMSFVDFAFYGSYSLMGLYRAQFLLTWEYLSNKALGIFYIYVCTMYTVKIVHASWFAGPNAEGKINSNQFDEATVHYVSNHLSPEAVQSRHARMLNGSYVLSMMAFQIILTTLQNSPGPCVILLFIVMGVNFSHFIYTAVKLFPFKTALNTLERFAYEICLATFICAITLRKIDFYHPYEDYLVIGMVASCILIQAIVTIKVLVEALRLLCKKRTPTLDKPYPSFISSTKSSSKQLVTKVALKEEKMNKVRGRNGFRPPSSVKIYSALDGQNSPTALKSPLHQGLLRVKKKTTIQNVLSGELKKVGSSVRPKRLTIADPDTALAMKYCNPTSSPLFKPTSVKMMTSRNSLQNSSNK